MKKKYEKAKNKEKEQTTKRVKKWKNLKRKQKRTTKMGKKEN